MSKSINIRTEDFRQAIMDLISSSEIPATNIYYVLKDVLNDVATAYQDALNHDMQELQKENKDDKDEQSE